MKKSHREEYKQQLQQVRFKSFHTTEFLTALSRDIPTTDTQYGLRMHQCSPTSCFSTLWHQPSVRSRNEEQTVPYEGDLDTLHNYRWHTKQTANCAVCKFSQHFIQCNRITHIQYKSSAQHRLYSPKPKSEMIVTTFVDSFIYYSYTLLSTERSSHALSDKSVRCSASLPSFWASVVTALLFRVVALRFLLVSG